MNGIFLVDKDLGETSYDVVRKVKEVAGIKKVGHAGTLDPFATGLLIILLEQGTKLSSYLMVGPKRYRATVCLGTETDTMDPEGQVLNKKDVPNFSIEFIEKITREFLGEIEQIPPRFSAVHVNGKRAYEFARKGIDVQIKKDRYVFTRWTLCHLFLLNW